MQQNALSFNIENWAAWTPDSDSNAPLTTSSSLRRRLSPIAQQAANAAWILLPEGSVRIVFSSRHGEFKRTVSLFESLAVDDGVSPADFTLSVHHALTGLLSIAQGNREGHIAVSAGEESFCSGFMEALACLQESPEKPVLFLHYDEPLPAPFSEFITHEEHPIAIAMLLHTGSQYTFRFAPTTSSASDTHALAFLNFLKGDAPELTTKGERMTWHWARNVAA